MIFPKSIAGKVARGEATLTIRPATTRPPAHGARRCVKVTQRGAISCYITVVGVEDLLAGEVTFKQARACGFKTTDDFKEAWVQTYDKAWLAAMDEGGDGDDYVVEPIQRARFHARHAFTPCYAISFKLTVDEPRFLASPGKGEVDGRGNADYTRQRHRAIDDLEVVPEQYQAKLSKDALGFCIGRQQKRAREQAEAKAERGRSMRLAPHERMNRRAA